MALAVKQKRAKLADAARALLDADVSAELKAALQGWLDNMDDADQSRAFGEQITALLPCELSKADGDVKAWLTDLQTYADYFEVRLDLGR